MRKVTRTLQIETPVGPVSITATAEAIVSLHFGRRVPVGSQLLAHGPELSERAGSEQTADREPELLKGTGSELSIGHEPELLKGTGSELSIGHEPELLKGTGSDLSIGREPELSEGTGLEQPAEAASEPEKSTQESTTPEERACRLLWLAAVELGEYFAGRRRDFTLPLAPRGTEFQQRVWSELRRIPCGETRTYGEIARAIGQPRACRAVGMANNRNPIAILIPCHRVIGRDGSLTGYAAGLNVKRQLLELERR